MVQLNSFFFVILILKQVDHFFSVQQEIPKNDIQPQQQPSLLSQDLPEGKLAAIEIQHESDKTPAGRTENTIDDELEIDGVNAVHQTNDLNEMINQIKKVENFHEQLELNNELSAGEGNPDSSKEMVSSTTIFTTIETNAKSNFPEIPLPETINQNISLLEKEVDFLNQINTANMNMFKNKSSNNNLDEKNLNYIISKPKEVIQLKLNLNLSRNKSDIKNDIILNHSIHYENRAVNKHDDHNSLKIKEKLPNSSKENESKELNEESIRVEELSLWEKILLGIRCARQDCRQDAFIIEEQDEKLNQQRLIKGWKITRRARRIFTCPCKNILL